MLAHWQANDADNVVVPTDSGTQEEQFLIFIELKDLGAPRSESVGDQATRLLQCFFQAIAAQCELAEISEDLLPLQHHLIAIGHLLLSKIGELANLAQILRSRAVMLPRILRRTLNGQV